MLRGKNMKLPAPAESSAPSPKPRRWMREIAKRVAVLVFLWMAWLAWNPGEDLRDGRHDRRENGIWLAHGWIGGDEWFRRNRKEAEKPRYRSPEALTELAARLTRHGVTEVYPHLCPVEAGGRLPPVDAMAAEHFLDALPGMRVWPWVGGTLDHVRLEDPQWRGDFTANLRGLLTAHPRLTGVHLNIEPLPDGTAEYLLLLDEIRAVLPPGKKLSIAAYPPPTRWQPSPEVHWGESYFREVSRRSDQMVVMTYDTGIRFEKAYTLLMSQWTREILEWSEGRPVLLGVPAYEDAHTSYHKPEIENIPNALAGIHAGLRKFPVLPGHYRGIAIYSDWEMNPAKWQAVEERFGSPH